MRKTQIALAAVALVASSAALANGVTVSGSLDAGIASQNSAIGGAKTTNFVEGNWNGGSHMTFAGSEDLGGGLKVGFTLQTGFSMKDGRMANGGTVPTTAPTTATPQSVFNRQANVSLGGEFGTVTLGQQLNPYIAGATGTELPNSAFGAFTVGSLLSSASGGIPGGFFTPNAVSYATPNIGGLSASVLAQLKGSGNAEDEAMGASASYNIGDIKLSGGYLNRKGTYSTTTNSGTGYTIGGLIPLGAFSVNLRYSTQDPAGSTAATNAVNAGVAYAVSEAVTVSAQYSDQSGAGKGNLGNLSAYYALSKTTGLYAMYSRASGGSSLFYSGGPTTSTSTATQQSWAIGAVKNF